VGTGGFGQFGRRSILVVGCDGRELHLSLTATLD
jgi:hypothetical protein